jgi:hypothetical protein
MIWREQKGWQPKRDGYTMGINQIPPLPHLPLLIEFVEGSELPIQVSPTPASEECRFSADV